MAEMTVYKVHRKRIALALVLVNLAILVLCLKPSRECLQVSILLQKDSHPYDGGYKRTRVVQALEPGPSWKRILSRSNLENLLRPRIPGPVASSESSDIVSKPPDEKDLAKSPRNINEFLATKFHYDTNDVANPPRNKMSLPLSVFDALFRTRLVQEEPSDNEDYAAPDGVDEDDVASENDEFEEGDFDYDENNQFLSSSSSDSNREENSLLFKWYSYSGGDRPKPGSSELNKMAQAYSSQFLGQGHHRYHRSKLRNITLINIEGVPIVEDHIYWSVELEDKAPKGIDDSETQTILQRLRALRVRKVEPPTWNRCGRPKNQFLIFEDGTKACARYRYPHQYLVQGEVLSFYLSRLLGIQNVPVVALANTSQDAGSKWSEPQVLTDLQKSEWDINTTVAIIQWIENLERDKMPPLLTSSLSRGDVISSHSASLLTLPAEKLVGILQWSDLVLFDYITGNYDRVASMQDAADKENKTSILQETVHNLVRSKTGGGLWLIDNESGLLDSYSLLYGPPGHDGRFLQFHRDMLRIVCVFRRSTVDRVRWLHRSNKAGEILMGLVQAFEPLFEPVKNPAEVSRRLQERIAEVHRHIEQCIADAS